MTASGALVRCTTLRSLPDLSVNSRAPGPLFVISHSSFLPSSWYVKLGVLLRSPLLRRSRPRTSRRTWSPNRPRSSTGPPRRGPRPCRASYPPPRLPFPRRPVRLALRGGCLVARFVFSGLALCRTFAPDAALRENGRDQDRGECDDAVSFSASPRKLLGLQRVLYLAGREPGRKKEGGRCPARSLPTITKEPVSGFRTS
jgi:hypothetical protein